MARLMKKQTVLELATVTSLRAIFTDPDDDSAVGATLDAEIWEDMGRPKDITVTFEPGDKLNPVVKLTESERAAVDQAFGYVLEPEPLENMISVIEEIRVDEIDEAGRHFLHKATWLLAGSVEVEDE